MASPTVPSAPKTLGVPGTNSGADSGSAACTGGCLCGAVRFTLSQPVKTFSVCHCSMCRRWTGGPMMTVPVTGSIVFEGEDHIATYRSSDWAERAFCRTCGSSLFYRLVETGEMWLPLGGFDDPSGLEMELQVFIESKPPGYAFANATPVMTGAEVLAQAASR